jgi:hypothetical protein
LVAVKNAVKTVVHPEFMRLEHDTTRLTARFGGARAESKALGRSVTDAAQAYKTTSKHVHTLTNALGAYGVQFNEITDQTKRKQLVRLVDTFGMAPEKVAEFSEGLGVFGYSLNESLLAAKKFEKGYKIPGLIEELPGSYATARKASAVFGQSFSVLGKTVDLNAHKMTTTITQATAGLAKALGKDAPAAASAARDNFSRMTGELSAMEDVMLGLRRGWTPLAKAMQFGGKSISEITDLMELGKKSPIAFAREIRKTAAGMEEWAGRRFTKDISRNVTSDVAEMLNMPKAAFDKAAKEAEDAAKAAATAGIADQELEKKTPGAAFEELTGRMRNTAITAKEVSDGMQDIIKQIVVFESSEGMIKGFNNVREQLAKIGTVLQENRVSEGWQTFFAGLGEMGAYADQFDRIADSMGAIFAAIGATGTLGLAAVSKARKTLKARAAKAEAKADAAAKKAGKKTTDAKAKKTTTEDPKAKKKPSDQPKTRRMATEEPRGTGRIKEGPAPVRGTKPAPRPVSSKPKVPRGGPKAGAGVVAIMGAEALTGGIRGGSEYSLLQAERGLEPGGFEQKTRGTLSGAIDPLTFGFFGNLASSMAKDEQAGKSLQELLFRSQHDKTSPFTRDISVGRGVAEAGLMTAAGIPEGLMTLPAQILKLGDKEKGEEWEKRLSRVTDPFYKEMGIGRGRPPEWVLEAKKGDVDPFFSPSEARYKPARRGHRPSDDPFGPGGFYEQRAKRGYDIGVRAPTKKKTRATRNELRHLGISEDEIDKFLGEGVSDDVTSALSATTFTARRARKNLTRIHQGSDPSFTPRGAPGPVKDQTQELIRLITAGRDSTAGPGDERKLTATMNVTGLGDEISDPLVKRLLKATFGEN